LELGFLEFAWLCSTADGLGSSPNDTNTLVGRWPNSPLPFYCQPWRVLHGFLHLRHPPPNQTLSNNKTTNSFFVIVYPVGYGIS
jgi:hypothetical protein